MENQYKLRLEKIEEHLNSWLPKNSEPLWFEKVFELPGEYIDHILLESLAYPGWDLVNRGGKRWRPLLMYLIAEALAGEHGAAAALPLTPMVEFAHNASLIHDDIEDNSDIRRGKPAVHLLYGNDAAINSGSFLYFLSTACLSSSEIKCETKYRIQEAWNTYMRRLHLGQAMDINWHKYYYSLPDMLLYEKMCRLKTGCLARLAAILAVLCVKDLLNASCGEVSDKNQVLTDNNIEILGEAAEKLGLGFQILDDVKNLMAGAPGKKRGDDIVEGKKSLPVLFYLHRYPKKQEYVVSCFEAARSKGIDAPELEEFIKDLEKTGILEESKGKGEEFIKESRMLFAEFSVFKDDRAKKMLTGLIDFISS